MAFDSKMFTMKLGENLMNNGLGKDKKPGTQFYNAMMARKKKNQFGMEDLSKGVNADMAGSVAPKSPTPMDSSVAQDDDELKKKFKYLA